MMLENTQNNSRAGSTEGNPLVSINIVVLNGEKYIRHCLEAVKKQVYPNIEINVLDNGSTDKTKNIVREFAGVNLIESDTNYGTWVGHEKALEKSRGKYIMCLSTDVMPEPNAASEAVGVFESDKKIGAVQPKMYRFELKDGQIHHTNQIDSCGFKIYRSRKVLNIGHGTEDEGQFSKQKEVFAVEGAGPIFRREALEDCRIDGELADRDMFWYGDDLDLAWRMRLFGWKEIYVPSVVMYHDRSTTHGLTNGWYKYFSRIKDRKKIPIRKRRLDWRNTRLTLVKNDQRENIIRDIVPFAAREVMVLGYALIAEPQVLLEIPNFFRLIPKALKKRKRIMRRAKTNPEQIHLWMK